MKSKYSRGAQKCQKQQNIAQLPKMSAIFKPITSATATERYKPGSGHQLIALALALALPLPLPLSQHLCCWDQHSGLFFMVGQSCGHKNMHNSTVNKFKKL